MKDLKHLIYFENLLHECCFWGYVKIDKAKVFLNWVQKPSPRERDYHNSLFPLFDYSFI